MQGDKNNVPRQVRARTRQPETGVDVQCCSTDWGQSPIAEGYQSPQVFRSNPKSGVILNVYELTQGHEHPILSGIH